MRKDEIVKFYFCVCVLGGKREGGWGGIRGVSGLVQTDSLHMLVAEPCMASNFATLTLVVYDNKTIFEEFELV
jgi:hypothetical protein